MTLAVAPSHAASLTRLGHALADPTRTRILLALTVAPASPSELAEQLGVTRQVMSNQLACLRGCGLVVGERDGRRTWYRLVDPELGSGLDDLLRVLRAVDPTCCTGEECRCA